MFVAREPSACVIDDFLSEQRQQPFSYPEVGASRGFAPPGYNVDHNRVLLGEGEETFLKASAALAAWKMFEFSWCRVYPTASSIAVGTTVAIVVRHLGFWSLNACRIVYTIEEDGKLHRSGFAYGTLTEHAEIGEERFSVEWNREDGSVWYDLYAFSKPGQLLAQLGYPISRALQRRFARESKAAMVTAVR